MNFESIGKAIQSFRKSKRMTQKQLAEKIGKAESSVQKYEAGKVEIPVSVLESVADALNISTSELINDYELTETDITDIELAYMAAFGYQIEKDCSQIPVSYIVKHQGFSYTISLDEYADLMVDIARYMHYVTDKLLERHKNTRRKCKE